MRRIVGILLIAFSLFVAFAAILTFNEDPKDSLFMIFLFSFPFFLIGQLTRTNLIKLRRNGFRWIWGYVYVVFLIPGLLFSIGSYDTLKRNLFSSHHFVLFETVSNPEIRGFSLLFIFALTLLFAFPFYDTTLKWKKRIAISAVIVTLLYAGYQYMTWMDYRGVHEEDGLITHPWNEEEQVIPYTDVDLIVFQPFVKYASLSNPSGTTHFKWRVIFVTNHAQEISYQFFLEDSSLSVGNELKQLAQSKKIPIHIIPMTKKQRKELDFQLELKDLEKEPYYSFFNIEES